MIKQIVERLRKNPKWNHTGIIDKTEWVMREIGKTPEGKSYDPDTLSLIRQEIYKGLLIERSRALERVRPEHAKEVHDRFLNTRNPAANIPRSIAERLFQSPEDVRVINDFTALHPATQKAIEDYLPNREFEGMSGAEQVATMRRILAEPAIAADFPGESTRAQLQRNIARRLSEEGLSWRKEIGGPKPWMEGPRIVAGPPRTDSKDPLYVQSPQGMNSLLDALAATAYPEFRAYPLSQGVVDIGAQDQLQQASPWEKRRTALAELTLGTTSPTSLGIMAATGVVGGLVRAGLLKAATNVAVKSPVRGRILGQAAHAALPTAFSATLIPEYFQATEQGRPEVAEVAAVAELGPFLPMAVRTGLRKRRSAKDFRTLTEGLTPEQRSLVQSALKKRAIGSEFREFLAAIDEAGDIDTLKAVVNSAEARVARSIVDDPNMSMADRKAIGSLFTDIKGQVQESIAAINRSGATKDSPRFRELRTNAKRSVLNVIKPYSRFNADERAAMDAFDNLIRDRRAAAEAAAVEKEAAERAATVNSTQAAILSALKELGLTADVATGTQKSSGKGRKSPRRSKTTAVPAAPEPTLGPVDGPAPAEGSTSGPSPGPRSPRGRANALPAQAQQTPQQGTAPAAGTVVQQKSQRRSTKAPAGQTQQTSPSPTGQQQQPLTATGVPAQSLTQSAVQGLAQQTTTRPAGAAQKVTGPHAKKDSDSPEIVSFVDWVNSVHAAKEENLVDQEVVDTANRLLANYRRANTVYQKDPNKGAAALERTRANVSHKRSEIQREITKARGARTRAAKREQALAAAGQQQQPQQQPPQSKPRKRVKTGPKKRTVRLTSQLINSDVRDIERVLVETHNDIIDKQGENGEDTQAIRRLGSTIDTLRNNYQSPTSLANAVRVLKALGHEDKIPNHLRSLAGDVVPGQEISALPRGRRGVKVLRDQTEHIVIGPERNELVEEFRSKLEVALPGDLRLSPSVRRSYDSLVNVVGVIRSLIEDSSTRLTRSDVRVTLNALNDVNSILTDKSLAPGAKLLKLGPALQQALRTMRTLTRNVKRRADVMRPDRDTQALIYDYKYQVRGLVDILTRIGYQDVGTIRTNLQAEIKNVDAAINASATTPQEYALGLDRALHKLSNALESTFATVAKELDDKALDAVLDGPESDKFTSGVNRRADDDAGSAILREARGAAQSSPKYRKLKDTHATELTPEEKKFIRTAARLRLTVTIGNKTYSMSSVKSILRSYQRLRDSEEYANKPDALVAHLVSKHPEWLLVVKRVETIRDVRRVIGDPKNYQIVRQVKGKGKGKDTYYIRFVRPKDISPDVAAYLPERIDGVAYDKFLDRLNRLGEVMYVVRRTATYMFDIGRAHELAESGIGPAPGTSQRVLNYLDTLKSFHPVEVLDKPMVLTLEEARAQRAYQEAQVKTPGRTPKAEDEGEGEAYVNLTQEEYLSFADLARRLLETVDPAAARAAEPAVAPAGKGKPAWKQVDIEQSELVGRDEPVQTIKQLTTPKSRALGWARSFVALLKSERLENFPELVKALREYEESLYRYHDMGEDIGRVRVQVPKAGQRAAVLNAWNLFVLKAEIALTRPYNERLRKELHRWWDTHIERGRTHLAALRRTALSEWRSAEQKLLGRQVLLEQAKAELQAMQALANQPNPEPGLENTIAAHQTEINNLSKAIELEKAHLASLKQAHKESVDAVAAYDHAVAVSRKHFTTVAEALGELHRLVDEQDVVVRKLRTANDSLSTALRLAKKVSEENLQRSVKVGGVIDIINAVKQFLFGKDDIEHMQSVVNALSVYVSTFANVRKRVKDATENFIQISAIDPERIQALSPETTNKLREDIEKIQHDLLTDNVALKKAQDDLNKAIGGRASSIFEYVRLFDPQIWTGGAVIRTLLDTLGMDTIRVRTRHNDGEVLPTYLRRLVSRTGHEPDKPQGPKTLVDAVMGQAGKTPEPINSDKLAELTKGSTELPGYILDYATMRMNMLVTEATTLLRYGQETGEDVSGALGALREEYEDIRSALHSYQGNLLEYDNYMNARQLLHALDNIGPEHWGEIQNILGTKENRKVLEDSLGKFADVILNTASTSAKEALGYLQLELPSIKVPYNILKPDGYALRRVDYLSSRSPIGKPISQAGADEFYRLVERLKSEWQEQGKYPEDIAEQRDVWAALPAPVPSPKKQRQLAPGATPATSAPAAKAPDAQAQGTATPTPTPTPEPAPTTTQAQGTATPAAPAAQAQSTATPTPTPKPKTKPTPTPTPTPKAQALDTAAAPNVPPKQATPATQAPVTKTQQTSASKATPSPSQVAGGETGMESRFPGSGIDEDAYMAALAGIDKGSVRLSEVGKHVEAQLLQSIKELLDHLYKKAGREGIETPSKELYDAFTDTIFWNDLNRFVSLLPEETQRLPALKKLVEIIEQLQRVIINNAQKNGLAVDKTSSGRSPTSVVPTPSEEPPGISMREPEHLNVTPYTQWAALDPAQKKALTAFVEAADKVDELIQKLSSSSNAKERAIATVLTVVQSKARSFHSEIAHADPSLEKLPAGLVAMARDESSWKVFNDYYNQLPANIKQLEHVRAVYNTTLQWRRAILDNAKRRGLTVNATPPPRISPFALSLIPPPAPPAAKAPLPGTATGAGKSRQPVSKPSTPKAVLDPAQKKAFEDFIEAADKVDEFTQTLRISTNAKERAIATVLTVIRSKARSFHSEIAHTDPSLEQLPASLLAMAQDESSWKVFNDYYNQLPASIKQLEYVRAVYNTTLRWRQIILDNAERANVRPSPPTAPSAPPPTAPSAPPPTAPPAPTAAKAQPTGTAAAAQQGTPGVIRDVNISVEHVLPIMKAVNSLIRGMRDLARLEADEEAEKTLEVADSLSAMLRHAVTVYEALSKSDIKQPSPALLLRINDEDAWRDFDSTYKALPAEYRNDPSVQRLWETARSWRADVIHNAGVRRQPSVTRARGEIQNVQIDEAKYEEYTNEVFGIVKSLRDLASRGGSGSTSNNRQANALANMLKRVVAFYKAINESDPNNPSEELLDEALDEEAWKEFESSFAALTDARKKLDSVQFLYNKTKELREAIIHNAEVQRNVDILSIFEGNSPGLMSMVFPIPLGIPKGVRDEAKTIVRGAIHSLSGSLASIRAHKTRATSQIADLAQTGMMAARKANARWLANYHTLSESVRKRWRQERLTAEQGHERLATGRSHPDPVVRMMARASWSEEEIALDRFLTIYATQTGKTAYDLGLGVERVAGSEVNQALVGQNVTFYDRTHLRDVQGTLRGFDRNSLPIIDVPTGDGNTRRVTLEDGTPFWTASVVKPETYLPLRVKDEYWERLQDPQSPEHEEAIAYIASTGQVSLVRGWGPRRVTYRLALDPQSRDFGLITTDAEGTQTGFVPFDQAMQTAESRETIEAILTRANTLFKKVVSDSVARTQNVAPAMLPRQFQGRSVTYAGPSQVEYPRVGFRLPLHMLEDPISIIPHHIDRTNRRFAYASVFGRSGETLAKLTSEAERESGMRGISENVKKDVDAVFGLRDTPYDPVLAGVTQYRLAAQTAAVLTKLTGGVTTLIQLTTSGNTTATLGVGSMLRGLKAALTDRAMIRRITEAGVIDSTQQNLVTFEDPRLKTIKLSEAAVKYTGIEIVDRSLRYHAAASGRMAAMHAIASLKVNRQGALRRDANFRLLTDWFNYTPQELVTLYRRYRSNPRNIFDPRVAELRRLEDKAFYGGVRTQGIVASEQVPSFLHRHPNAKWFLTLQSFALAQTRILGWAIREAMRGNAKPLLVMAAAYAAFGYMRDEIEKLLGADRKPLSGSTIGKLGYYMSKAGMFGLVEPLVQPAAVQATGGTGYSSLKSAATEMMIPPDAKAVLGSGAGLGMRAYATTGAIVSSLAGAKQTSANYRALADQQPTVTEALYREIVPFKRVVDVYRKITKKGPFTEEARRRRIQNQAANTNRTGIPGAPKPPKIGQPPVLR